MAKQKIVVVCGPTASGKTGLALALSRRLGGEMVGADSMQIYRGLVIGTAALLPCEAEGVPQHLTGFLPPEQEFSVADYVAAAGQAIGEIAARGALPLVCGGTGLYIKSLVEGIRFAADKTPPALRERLLADWQREGGAAMLERLAVLDPAAAARLHPNDQKRVLRALEAAMCTGTTADQRLAASRPARPPFDALCIGLDFADRATLYRHIERRVDRMMDNGLLDEARMVYENRAHYKTAAQAIGYKEFFPYFEGESTQTDCVTTLKQATRRYAKRQLTWFRHMPGIHWLNAESLTLGEQATALVLPFLHDD